MGAWSFIRPRFENMCGRKISYCGRSVVETFEFTQRKKKYPNHFLCINFRFK